MLNDVIPDQQRQAQPITKRAIIRVSPPSEGLVAARPVHIAPVHAKGSAPDVEWLQPTSPATPEDSASELIHNGIVRAERAVARHPGSSRAHNALAQALWRAGELAAAAHHCALALEREPSHYPAMLLLARIHETQGEVGRAVGLYERAHALRPTETAPLVGLAHRAIADGRFEAARAWLQKVVTIDESNAVPRFQLGMVLLRLGQANEAISQLKQATRIDVRSPVLRCALGLAYWSAGSPRRAEQQFRGALHVLPSYAPAARTLGHLLLFEKRYEPAVRFLEEWLTENPDHSSVRELLGRALFTQGAYRRAAAELKTTLATMERKGQDATDRARVSNNVAVCYSRLEAPKVAERWYRKALQLEPRYAAARRNLARVLLAGRRAAEAVDVLRAAEDTPDDAFLLALALANSGGHQEAVEKLAALVRRTDAPAEAFSFLSTLFLDEREDAHQAIPILEEGRRRFPTHLLIANNLAYSLLQVDRIEEARSILEGFPEASTDDVFMRATWGLLHIREGDLDAGIDGYRAAQALAAAQGNRELANRARQKMSLELARHYLRIGDRAAAAREVQLGLDVADKYKQQLMELQRSLRP
jgi:tetratricopeptide (TPR) repeat protein